MKERTSPRRSQALPALRSERLLDQVRERMRYLHYSIRTEQAYVHWVRAFVRFHGLRVIRCEMGAPEVEAFLSWLAAERGVAAATHRQALSAIVFLYEKVLGLELPWLAEHRPAAGAAAPAGRAHARRGRRRAGVLASRRASAASPAALRHRHAHHGGPAPAREGRRVRAPCDRRARRQGREGPRRHAAGVARARPARAAARAAAGSGQRDRDDGRAGVHLPDALARKYPRAASSWTLVLGLPAGGARGRPAQRRRAAPPRVRPELPARLQARARRGRHRATSRRRRTRCAIRSPRTCCRPATTSAPCRSCSATPTSARR